MEDALMEAKYKMLMEQQMKKYEQYLAKLGETTQSLVNEVQALKMNHQSLLQEVQQLKSSGVSVQKQQPERQKVLDEKPAVHPRQGNYKPEDVDIQKMFYFGHK